jgi:hypothetical protein
MDKKTKWILGIGIVVALLAVIFWPRKKDLNKMDEPGPDMTGGGADGGGGGASGGSGKTGTAYTPGMLTGAVTGMTPKGYGSVKFPIVRPDKGPHVKLLQQAINFNWKYYGIKKSIKTDGAFGPATIAALAADFSEPQTVTEGRWRFIIDRHKAGIPIGRTYVNDDQWPLKLGDHESGSAKQGQIRRLNIAMGVYAYNTTDPKAAEFGPLLRQRIIDRYKVSSVSLQLFMTIIQNGFWAKTLNT